jgi:hypothetical protein
MFLSDKKTFAKNHQKWQQNAALSGCRQRLGGAFPF